MKKKKLSQVSTYVPKRKILSVETSKTTIDSDELLNGVYVKGRKRKFNKGGEMMAKGGMTKALSARKASEKIMEIESAIWDKLNIDSGSQLYSDQDLQKKYVSEHENAGTEKIVDLVKDKQKVFDLLEDENYHAVNSLLTAKGEFGTKALDRLKWNYNYQIQQFGYALTLNPYLINSKMEDGGRTAIAQRMPTLEEKVEDIVGKESWHNLNAEEKADLVTLFVSDGDVRIPFSHGGMMKDEDANWGEYEPSMRVSGDRYVVYSKSHGVMSFKSEDEARDYMKEIKRDLLNLSYGLEEDVIYAKGGLTDTTKYKVTYQVKGLDQPKEKIFDDKTKAETFVELMSDDEDISKIKMEEVKEKSKKATPKNTESVAAPVSLFGMAKPTTPTTTPTTKKKPQVRVAGIADDIRRYDELHAIIKNAEAEKEVLHGTLRQIGIDKFMEQYEQRGSNPGNFELADGDQSILFMVKDQYEKVTPEKAGILEAYPGLLGTETKYSFDPATLERVGDVVSRIIMESRLLSDEDKRNLLVAETKQFVKKGSVDRLLEYEDPRMIFDIIKPQTGLK